MKSVVIYGGGLAGAQLAYTLQKDAAVTLVSPLTYFEVPMAMPRTLVEPEFSKNSIVSLSESLPNVNHVQGKLVLFDQNSGQVEMADGTHVTLKGDVSVLATGSRYANNLTRAHEGKLKGRQQEFLDFADRLKRSQNILIVGGGPIGIEIAGEITEDFPDKNVTLVESNTDLLKGTSRKVAAYAHKELSSRGVTFHLGQRVVEPAYGVEPNGGVAKTDNGTQINYDLIFWAVGSKPNTDYFPPDMLSSDNRVPVDEHFRVKGMENVFAIGDITALDEVKKAIYVIGHLKTVKKNIRAVLAGKTPRATYKPQTGNDIMVVTLGRSGGVAHIPVLGTITANWTIKLLKSKDMLAGMYRKKVGAN